MVSYAVQERYASAKQVVMATPLTPLLSRMRTVDPGGRPVQARVTRPRVLRSAERTLNETVLCSIATIGAGNSAHINTAYFSFSRGLDLYFLSHPDSLHCRNLSRNPRAAVAVYSSRQNWDGPDRGLQLFGRCAEARGRAAVIATRSYSRRFPGYRAWVDRAPGSAAAYRFYRFTTSTVKVFDESELGDGVFVMARVTHQSS